MKLIITRPLQDSKKMFQYFESKGLSCLVNPLLKISYEKIDINFVDYGGLILTSRHAVRSLAKKRKKFSKKIVYACGSSTYTEAKIFAPDNEYIFYESVSDLVDAFKSSKGPNLEKILYLRGRDVTIDIRLIFKGTGIVIDDCIEYTAEEKVSFNSETLEEFENSKQISIIIYSIRTAKIFLKALKKYNLGNKTSIIMAYCISRNIANILQDEGIQSKILVNPSEDAILDLL